MSSSSLLPTHSLDLASTMSSHLTSALRDDHSYSQMNDAKMRGMSAMVGWDQFHGMVLTAHLQPVNLRADPIDEIAHGIARNKKIEQAAQRQAQNYTLEQLKREREADGVAVPAVTDDTTSTTSETTASTAPAVSTTTAITVSSASTAALPSLPTPTPPTAVTTAPKSSNLAKWLERTNTKPGSASTATQ